LWPGRFDLPSTVPEPHRPCGACAGAPFEGRVGIARPGRGAIDEIISVFRYYRNMALTYSDVGAHIFGEREFDAAEFGRRTGNPRAAKVLSELLVRGVVARKRRGRYRFLRPSERPDLRIFEWRRMREIALGGPDPKTWDGPTAVEAWTGGRYRVSPTVFTAVFHVAVPKGATPNWERYLSNHGVSLKGRKRIGARIELREVRRVRAEVLNGEPVPPREVVLSMIRAHPGIYANAEALVIGRPGDA